MTEVDLTLDFERLQLSPPLFLFLHHTQSKNIYVYTQTKITKHNIVTKKGSV